MKRWWTSAAVVLLGAAVLAGCGGNTANSGQSAATTTGGGVTVGGTALSGTGKVKVIYDEAGVKPENLEAFRIVKEDGGLDRLAGWFNERFGLPKDISVRVTDNVPKGVTDASFDPIDGATIWEPASFFSESLAVAKKVVPEAKAAGKVPAVLTDAEWTPEKVVAGSSEFIFGHELGHMLSFVTHTPTLTLEEYQADGFAAFSTLNNKGSGNGYKPAIYAAALFDGLADAHGEPTVSDYSSDHPVIQARIYNFLCYAAGSDPDRLRAPLIDAGFVPEGRSPFCPLQWAQLDYGWWRVLEPLLTSSGTAKTATDRQQAKEHYEQAQVQFKDTVAQLRERGA